MLAACAGAFVPAAFFHSFAQANNQDDAEVEVIQDEAMKVGLANFKATHTERYLAVGDAPSSFRTDALAICELVYQDWFKHFREKGFELDEPKSKLIVIALAGAKSFQAFTEEDPLGVVGGFYDRDTNRLIFYDFRNTPTAVRKPKEANTMALVHEATHQLCFNTGLLERKGDVPGCISEGLAMYCEQRPPNKHTEPGKVNVERLKVLRESTSNGRAGAWIPLDQMIANDDKLDPEVDPDALQLAYAESWLFVHMLMRQPDLLPKFRNYLAAIKNAPRPRTGWQTPASIWETSSVWSEG